MITAEQMNSLSFNATFEGAKKLTDNGDFKGEFLGIEPAKTNSETSENWKYIIKAKVNDQENVELQDWKTLSRKDIESYTKCVRHLRFVLRDLQRSANVENTDEADMNFKQIYEQINQLKGKTISFTQTTSVVDGKVNYNVNYHA